jgi:glyoxylase-like metal-dependent hydrolase (beta-lactamase superfamily II)
MIFEQIRVGGDRNFAYLIGNAETKRAAVVDPAYSPELVLERAAAHETSVRFLINTHSHFDHAGGNEYVLSHTDATLVTKETKGDGDELILGSLTLRIMHTPGHTTDSICVFAFEAGSPGKLVTGDTLFVGKVGGTDFGSGARAEHESLWNKLLLLPKETEVWPGHDYGVAPSSTIGHEIETNPFLLRESFEDFVDLKRNWLAYKEEHGIA